MAGAQANGLRGSDGRFTRPVFDLAGGTPPQRDLLRSARFEPRRSARLDSRSKRMLSFPGSVRIYLAVEPVDMRKSFNGLFAVATESLKEDPMDGGLFVFSNKRRNRLKILFWDGTGLWVLGKRLEKGGFTWPKGADAKNGKLHLKNEALALLVGGIDLKDGMRKAWYEC